MYVYRRLMHQNDHGSRGKTSYKDGSISGTYPVIRRPLVALDHIVGSPWSLYLLEILMLKVKVEFSSNK
jgi:hypothetical protein